MFTMKTLPRSLLRYNYNCPNKMEMVEDFPKTTPIYLRQMKIRRRMKSYFRHTRKKLASSETVKQEALGFWDVVVLTSAGCTVGCVLGLGLFNMVNFVFLDFYDCLKCSL